MTRSVRAGSAHAPRRGIAAVEFAVVLPLLLMFIVGIWEVGRLIEVQQIMANAAREGGRQASAGQYSPSDITTLVQQYAAREGLTATNIAVSIKNLGFSGNPAPPDNDPRDATDLDQLQVTVTIPFSDVRWTTLSLVTGTSTTLTSQVVWSSMKDRAYAIPTPPAGY
jgi:Flp pilus assembly protein TadG